MLCKDAELKRQRGYTDPKSYVRNDGSEVLHRKDWQFRVAELWQRCRGVCEQSCAEILYQNAAGVISREVRCRVPAQEPHHIIRRSKARDDRLQNLQALCHFHHSLLDRRKPRWTKRELKTQNSGTRSES